MGLEQNEIEYIWHNFYCSIETIYLKVGGSSDNRFKQLLYIKLQSLK